MPRPVHFHGNILELNTALMVEGTAYHFTWRTMRLYAVKAGDKVDIYPAIERLPWRKRLAQMIAG